MIDPPRAPEPAGGGFAGGGDGRFTAGDPLRALSALAVLFSHAVVALDVAGRTPPEVFGDLGARVANASSAGLYVFFVLSGYLIARPFVAWAAGTGTPPEPRRYLWNRAVRIVPAFWVVTTVLLLIHGTRGDSTLEVLAVYAFAQNHLADAAPIPQGWTLVVEWQFYLALPVVAALFVWAFRGRSRRTRLGLLGGLLALLWVAGVALRARLPEAAGPVNELDQSLPAMVWAFAPGVALALFEAGGGRDRVAGTAGRRVPPALLAAAAAAFGLYVATQGGALPSLGRAALGSVLVSLASGALVAAALTRQWSAGRTWRALDNRPLHWLGARAYSFYLVHIAVLTALAPYTTGRGAPAAAFALSLAAALLGSLVVAHLSYELVERPFLRLRRRAPARAG